MSPYKNWMALAMVALAAGTAAGACFSERGTTGPDGFTCDVPIPEEVAGNTLIFIRDYEFVPASVTVAPGTEVSWINCGPLDSHTSTADDGAWNSPLLAPGGVYTREFGTAGTFEYHCAPHPFMEGSVVVQENG